MPSQPPTPSNRAACAAHGLFYDPRLNVGCVLCLRERAEVESTARGGQRSLALLLAALGVCVGALAFTIGTGALSGAPGAQVAGATAGATVVRDAETTRGVPARGRPLRVLFIGNSLTYSHDLPAMVSQLAQAASSARPFEPHAITFGGFTLSDHLGANAAAAKIAAGGWDAVVLQEQGQFPGWPEEREARFFASARTFHGMIRSAGARTVFYDTMARRDGDAPKFPHDDYAAMQRRVDEGYASIARELGADIAPVGPGYRALHQRMPDLSLWEPDGLHPSVAGTYLAACVFYTAFYEQSPIGNAFVPGLPANDALAIQEMADSVVLHGGPKEPTLADLEAPREAKPPSVAPKPGARAVREQEAEQDRLRHERITADIRAREATHERERRERMAGDRAGVPVTMYKTAWCGACKRASAYMQRQGIPVREYDVERDAEARTRSRRLNPRGSVPTIDVDGTVLIGWSEPRFEAMLAEAKTRRGR